MFKAYEKNQNQFFNGLDFRTGVKDILVAISDQYEFIDSANPGLVIFGPYRNNIPAGNLTKTGYFCENILPDMKIWGWAFRVPYETNIKHPKYTQIRWHGFDLVHLQKASRCRENNFSENQVLQFYMQ